MRRQVVPRWLTHSLTMVPPIDPKITMTPMNSAIALFGLGPATSSMHQKTSEESCPHMPQIIDPSTLVLAMDT